MLKLFVCGDVMLGRGIDQLLPEPCDPALHEPYLTDAREYIDLAEEVSGPIARAVPLPYVWGDALAALDDARPDARVINLETAITCRGRWDDQKEIHYRVSPRNAECLVEARIDACALANNHVLDFGEDGLADTVATLDRLGIAHAGAGPEPWKPAVLDRAVVFSVGCRDAGVPPWWSPHVATSDLTSTRELRDAIDPWRDRLVVVSIHWGPNWGFTVDPVHRRFAHALIDEAGVHLVHGHSSHHVKGIEVHHGQPILYGCGDLLTDYEGIRGHETYRGDLGLLYLPAFDDAHALAAFDMVPTRMRRLQITLAGPDEARWLAATLARTGESLGTTAVLDGQRLALRW